MKFKLFPLLILFFAFLRRNDSKPTYSDIDDASTDWITTQGIDISPSVLTTTPTPSQEDYLDNISIQDVLSSDNDIDGREKIEKKIIDTVTEYSNKCYHYKRIDISVDGLSFPQNSVTIDLDIANATFSHIAVREFTESLNFDEYSRSEKRKSYSTLIGCDSSRNAKVEVKLPSDIEISALLRVVEKTSDTTNEINAPSHTLDVGGIRFKLKNNAISQQFSMQTNSTNIKNNIISKILYTKSEVSLDIDIKFQMLIHNKLQTFFDEVELPIREFLEQKLNNYLNIYGIFFLDSCSKSVNSDKNSKKINLPFINTNLNHLYVIPDAKLDTWRSVPLSTGPILIDGLSHFNSTEFIATESDISSPDSRGQYYSTPSPYDDPEMKEITVRIKTNDLKGKLDWSYNFKKRSFPFSVEFIQFEIKKIISFSYVNVDNMRFISGIHSRTDYNMDNGYGRSGYEYTTPSTTTHRPQVDRFGLYLGHLLQRTDHNKDNGYGGSGYEYTTPSTTTHRPRYVKSKVDRFDVNVNLGHLQIKPSNSEICEKENEFVNFVLSEHLKTAIANSLQFSLYEKIQNERPFAYCIT